MSRKPIDQSTGAAGGQDGVWAHIRRVKVFTVTDIHNATGIPRKTISDYIKRLIAGGVVQTHGNGGDVDRFELVRDMGVHTPRFRPNGEPVTQGMGTQNMWRAMRMMAEFSPCDIAAHSSTDTVKVSEATAKTYCSHLLRSGYLRVLVKAIPGKRQARYRLIKDTGPLPPKVQRVKRVFDQNSGQVMHVEGARV
ncbi:MAG: hypothetical protein ACWA40_07405 [Planktomarina sp.]